MERGTSTAYVLLQAADSENPSHASHRRRHTKAMISTRVGDGASLQDSAEALQGFPIGKCIVRRIQRTVAGIHVWQQQQQQDAGGRRGEHTDRLSAS